MVFTSNLSIILGSAVFKPISRDVQKCPTFAQLFATPDDLALEMTRQYVSGLDFGKMLEMATGEGKGRHIIIEREKHDEDEDEE